ncbi:hypothetical protein Hanom_Chr12g01090141 [Helianthus anomalus]
MSQYHFTIHKRLNLETSITVFTVTACSSLVRMLHLTWFVGETW